MVRRSYSERSFGNIFSNSHSNVGEFYFTEFFLIKWARANPKTGEQCIFATPPIAFRLIRFRRCEWEKYVVHQIELCWTALFASSLTSIQLAAFMHMLMKLLLSRDQVINGKNDFKGKRTWSNNERSLSEKCTNSRWANLLSILDGDRRRTFSTSSIFGRVNGIAWQAMEREIIQ